VIRQFAVFLTVGLANTIAALAVILILSELLHVHYVLANALGYAFGLALGFTLHRNITFKQQSDPEKRQAEMFKFLVVFGVAYMIQLMALVVLVRSIGLADEYAQVVAIGVYAIVNFAGNRVFTFRKDLKDVS